MSARALQSLIAIILVRPKSEIDCASHFRVLSCASYIHFANLQRLLTPDGSHGDVIFAPIISNAILVDPLRRSACEKTRSSWVRTSISGASLLLGMKHTELLDKGSRECGLKGKEVIAGESMSYDVCVFPARHHDLSISVHDLLVHLTRHQFHIPTYSRRFMQYGSCTIDEIAIRSDPIAKLHPILHTHIHCHSTQKGTKESSLQLVNICPKPHS